MDDVRFQIRVLPGWPPADSVVALDDSGEPIGLTPRVEQTLTLITAAGRSGITSGQLTEQMSTTSEAIHGENAKGAAARTRMQVARLRKAIGRDLIAETSDTGTYRLALPNSAVDYWMLIDLAARPALPPALDLQAGELSWILTPGSAFGSLDSPVITDARYEVEIAQQRVLDRLVKQRHPLVRDLPIDVLRQHLAQRPDSEHLGMALAAKLVDAGQRPEAIAVVRSITDRIIDRGLGLTPDFEAVERELLDGTFDTDSFFEGEDPTKMLPAELRAHLRHRLVGPTANIETMVDGLDDESAVEVFIVSGESGVGKTRLCAEFALAATARDIPVLYLSADGRNWTHLGPFTVALRGLEPVVAEIVDARRSPVSTSHQLWTATFEALSTFADGQRILMIVDDAQWLDSQSLEVVSRLLRERRLLIQFVLAGRDDHESLSGWSDLILECTRNSRDRELAVERLSFDAVREIVAHDHRDLRPVALNRISEHLYVATNGLPGELRLALNAYGTDLESFPDLRFAERRTVSRAALGNLEQVEIEVGAIVSVLGPDARVDHIVALSGRDPAGVKDALDKLARKQLLQSSPPFYRASHYRVEAAFLDAAGEQAIIDWNLQAARMFSDDPHRRARHLLDANPEPEGDLETGNALVLSASDHLQRGLYREAVIAFRRAIICVGPGGLSLADTALYARSLDLCGLHHEAERARAPAFELAVSSGDAAAALDLATSGLPEAEVAEGSENLVERLLRLEQMEFERDDELRLHLQLARQAALVNRIDQAAKSTERADSLAAARAEPAELIEVLVAKRFTGQHPPASSLVMVEEALALANATSTDATPTLEVYRILDLYETGRVEDAHRHRQRVSVVAQEQWDALRNWHLRLFDAAHALSCGRVSDATRFRDDAARYAHAEGIGEGERAKSVGDVIARALAPDPDSAAVPARVTYLDPADNSPLTSVLRCHAMLAQNQFEGAARASVEAVGAVAFRALRLSVPIAAIVSPGLAHAGPAERSQGIDLLRHYDGALVVMGAFVGDLGPANRYLAMIDPDTDRQTHLETAIDVAEAAGFDLWTLICRRDMSVITGDSAWLAPVTSLARAHPLIAEPSASPFSHLV